MIAGVDKNKYHPTRKSVFCVFEKHCVFSSYLFIFMFWGWYFRYFHVLKITVYIFPIFSFLITAKCTKPQNEKVRRKHHWISKYKCSHRRIAVKLRADPVTIYYALFTRYSSAIVFVHSSAAVQNLLFSRNSSFSVVFGGIYFCPLPLISLTAFVATLLGLVRSSECGLYKK